MQTSVLFHYEELIILIHKTHFPMRYTGITSFQNQSFSSTLYIPLHETKSYLTQQTVRLIFNDLLLND